MCQYSQGSLFLVVPADAAYGMTANVSTNRIENLKVIKTRNIILLTHGMYY